MRMRMRMRMKMKMKMILIMRMRMIIKEIPIQSLLFEKRRRYPSSSDFASSQKEKIFFKK